MKIKVCGMRDASNIREVLGRSPDFIGFIFYPASKRFVGPSFVITDQMGDFGNCRRVGVFVNQPLVEIDAAVNAAKLDVIQLHGTEPVEFCRLVRARHPRLAIWKSVPVGEGFDPSKLAPYENTIDAFLFDTQSDSHGGSGRTFDWSLLSKYEERLPLVISGGIGADNIAAAAALERPGLPVMALDLNSKIESAPGVKSLELLDRALGALTK